MKPMASGKEEVVSDQPSSINMPQVTPPPHCSLDCNSNLVIADSISEIPYTNILG